MKKYSYIFLCSFILLVAVNIEAKNADLAESFIGEWETNVENANGTRVFMSAIYKVDGTCMTHVEFTIKNTLTTKADIEEVWEIIDDTIQYRITKSNNSELYEVGHESKVKIISVKEDVITLQNTNCDDFSSNTIFQLLRK